MPAVQLEGLAAVEDRVLALRLHLQLGRDEHDDDTADAQDEEVRDPQRRERRDGLREVRLPEERCDATQPRRCGVFIRGPRPAAFDRVARVHLLRQHDDGRREREQEPEVDEHARAAVDSEAAQ